MLPYGLTCAPARRLGDDGGVEVDDLELQRRAWAHVAQQCGLDPEKDGSCGESGVSPRTARAEQRRRSHAAATSGRVPASPCGADPTRDPTAERRRSCSPVLPDPHARLLSPFGDRDVLPGDIRFSRLPQNGRRPQNGALAAASSSASLARARAGASSTERNIYGVCASQNCERSS